MRTSAASEPHEPRALRALAEDDRARRLALFGGIIGVAFWGASFVASKRALAEVSPASLLFARSTLGALVVIGWTVARREWRPLRMADAPQLARLCLLGIVLTQLLQAYAMLKSSAANTSWLIAVSPIVTAILAWRLLGERLGAKWIGTIVAFAGAVLVVSGGAPLGAVLRLPSTRGDALTLVSTVSWAFYTISARRLVGIYAPRVMVAHLLLIAALAYSPLFVLAAGWRDLAALSPAGWFCILYLGVVCSGVSLVLWQAALEKLGASEVSALLYLEPLVTQVLAWALLGEPVRAAALCGGAAILLGVYLVSWSSAPVAVERVASPAS